jgi:hypothetical protein
MLSPPPLENDIAKDSSLAFIWKNFFSTLKKWADNPTVKTLSITALNTAPASATAPGTLGEIRITATAIYVCIATDVWVKTTLTTF